MLAAMLIAASGVARGAPALTLSEGLGEAPRSASPPAGDHRPAAVRLRMAIVLANVPDTERLPGPGEIYRDQYLQTAGADGEIDLADAYQPEGRRSLLTEYRLQSQETSQTRRTLEHGAVLDWSRETLLYGRLRFNALGRWMEQDEDSPGAESPDPGGTFLLAHDDLALTPGLLLDGALGDQPSRTSRLLSSSSRVNLPSSLMRGYAGQVRSRNTTVRATYGEIGSFLGTYSRSFELREGRISALDIEYSPSDVWEWAVRVGDFRDGATAPDHQNLTGGFRYRAGPRTQFRANVLASSGEQFGWWAEVQAPAASWTHQLGIFRLDPELRWNDASLAADRQGLHWRADSRNYLRTLYLGLDIEETNLSGRDDRLGRRNLSGFAGGSRRLLPNLRGGLTLSGALLRDGEGLNLPAGEDFGVTLYLSQDRLLGPSSVQLAYLVSDREDRNTDTARLSWSQSWGRPFQIELRTLARVEQAADSLVGQTRRYSGGFSARRPLAAGFRLSADLSYGEILSDQAATPGAGLAPPDAVTTTGNLSLTWDALRDWEVALSANYNRVEPKTTDGSAATVTDDTRALLSVRRSVTAGQSYTAYGRTGGLGGHGRLSGIVFFDDDGNGIFDPGERPATGVFVYLDGRIPRQTDADGRYEFFPVHSGDHRVSLGVEDLPLPFGLADDAPRVVTVWPRGDAIQDFPLVRLDEPATFSPDAR